MRHDFEQYSDEWWAARLGKPSASCASKLVTPSGGESAQMKDYAIELANDLYAGKVTDPWGGNKHTDRGAELEPDARIDYEMINQVPVVEVGMFTDNLMRWVASPDGCVGKDGLVEIKCLTGVNHTKALSSYKETGLTPLKYIPQTQMQMLISGKKWVDLVLYHPDLPGLTIRQYPDKLFYKTLRKQLKAIQVETNLVYEFLKSL